MHETEFSPAVSNTKAATRRTRAAERIGLKRLAEPELGGPVERSRCKSAGLFQPTCAASDRAAGRIGQQATARRGSLRRWPPWQGRGDLVHAEPEPARGRRALQQPSDGLSPAFGHPDHGPVPSGDLRARQPSRRTTAPQTDPWRPPVSSRWRQQSRVGRPATAVARRRWARRARRATTTWASVRGVGGEVRSHCRD